MSTPPPLESGNHTHANVSIILLHGLGADGHDLLPLAQNLAHPDWRFILPDAPVQHISLYGGQAMPAWYDIRHPNLLFEQDEAGFVRARQRVTDWISREVARGVTPQRIVLAGFSQGGAVAIYSGLTLNLPLAGIAGLSTYVPELLPANTLPPVWLAHGSEDNIIPLDSFQRSLSRLPQPAVSCQTYPMTHSICTQEIDDLRTWLTSLLA